MHKVTLKLWICSVLLVAGFLPTGMAQVTADFDAPLTTGCGVLELDMENLSTGADTYLWQVYNSSGTLVASSTLTNPNFFLVTADSYTVTLTATGAGGSDVLTIDDFATIYTPPNAEIDVDVLSGCPPLDITATNVSTPGSFGSIASYYWIITGAGTLPGDPVIDYTLETSGIYSVFLFVTDGAGCSDFAEVLVEADPAPILEFTADETVSCEEPFTVEFENLSSGEYMPFEYEWDFGDGSTSTAENPTHTYDVFGDYDVTLSATNTYGCSSTITLNDFIQIDPDVDVDFVPSTYNVCLGDTVYFDNLAGSPFGDWTWDFGDGTTSFEFEPWVVYDAIGTYTVTLDAYFGLGCTGFISYPALIEVGTAPTVDFSSGPTYSACELPFGVSFTPLITGTGPFDYLWEFEIGDGIYDTLYAPFPTFTWDSAGIFDVSLTVTDNFGCEVTASETDLVVIDTLVILPAAIPFQGCIPFSTDFSVFSSEELVSWYWNFGDGSSSTAPTPSHTYYDDSCYTITFIGTTINGCTDTIVMENYVCAGFTGAAGGISVPDTSCPSVPLDLEIFPVDSIFGYLDGTGAFGYTDAIDSITYLDLPIGYHEVELITYSSGCTDTFYFDIFIVNVNDSSLGFSYSCDVPLTVEFTMDSALADASCGFLWVFGDGEVDSVNYNPIHVYAEPGVYTAYASFDCITFAPCVGGQTDIVLTTPVAAFEMPTLSCDTPFTIDFENYSYDGVSESLQYLWNFDDGSADTTEAPSHTFTDFGEYIISLNITDTAGCTAEVLDTLLINNLVAFFDPLPPTGCVPTEASLDDGSFSLLSSITSWVVDWDDGTIDTFYSSAELEAAVHLYDDKKAYLVELTVTDSLGCISSYKDTIKVTQPTIDFSVSDSMPCIAATVTFEELATGSGLTYLWEFGDGETSTEANPEHEYAAYGVYDVTLTVTDDNGCSATLTKPAYVVTDTVNAFITYNELVSSCNYALVQFDITSDDTLCTYIWDFGDGGASGTSDPIYPYTEAGVYDISVTITSCSGCVATLTEDDFVLVPGPYGSITPLEDTVCIGNDAQFEISYSSTDTATIFYGNGDFGELDLIYDAELDTLLLPYTYDTSGVYFVSILLVDTNGCFNSLTLPDSLWVGNTPSSVYTVDSGACLGATFFFDENATCLEPIVAWNWDIGDSTFVDVVGTDFSYLYTSAGTYNTSLIVTTALGCADTFLQTINVLDTPVINISPDTVICPGEMVTLNAEGGIIYEWTPPDGLSDPTSSNPLASPDSTTLYAVYVSNGYCDATDTTLLTILSQIILDAGPDTALCLLGGIELFADLTTDVPADMISYEWFPPDGLSSVDTLSPYSSAESSITYYLVASCGALNDTADAIISIVAPPDVEVYTDTILLIQDQFAELDAVLVGSSSAVNYQWYPNDLVNCNNCPSVTVSPDVSTIFSVQVTDEAGCTDVDFIYVRVSPCDETLMFIPNIISPNGDGFNDVFRFSYEGITEIRNIYIFNRYGEQMYASTNPNNAWDGTFNGEICNPGVYVYTIEAVCIDGQSNVISGNITLVR